MSSMTSDEKLQQISSYLKDSVLEPAESEKNQIIDAANAEKDKIIAQAEGDAAAIIKDAQEKAAHEKKIMESALRIAAKQAIDTLKIALEKEVLKQSVIKPVKEVLSNETTIKTFISEILNIYLAKDGDDSVELALSEETKSALADYLKSEIIDKSSGRLSLSDEPLPSGFGVIKKEDSLMFDFSGEAVVELLSAFLRDDLRGYLFED